MASACERKAGLHWVRAFDYWNCFLQTGRSGMPWTVGNVQRISAIRAPVIGHKLPATEGYFGAAHRQFLASRPVRIQGD